MSFFFTTDTTDEDGRRTTYSYNADGDQTGETWSALRPLGKDHIHVMMRTTR